MFAHPNNPVIRSLMKWLLADFKQKIPVVFEDIE